ncbi:MAG TPA: hypothetical protein VGS19_24430 [Streptosporangiaceae bacterium]|nr:hypothetical protein [Streptosporangiaceae bacterium]
MDVASAWYSSGTFWAGAGVVVAALAAAAVVWVTLTVGFPRRRLHYGLRAAAPLLSAPAGMRSDLELRLRGTLLKDPYVLSVELVSRGRRDISNEAYNDRQPLELDTGCPIVEILQVTSEPEPLPPPLITADGTGLKIGPSLIGKRHHITINLLADGGAPHLSCRSPLIDVQVRQRYEEGPPFSRRPWLGRLRAWRRPPGSSPWPTLQARSLRVSQWHRLLGWPVFA